MKVKAGEVSNLPKWPHWVLAPATWCHGHAHRSGPSWGHPHLMGGAPWFYLGASSPFEEGAEKQLGSLGLSSPVFWKILFTLAFSWFYQIFFSGLLGHSSIPSADITFFFFFLFSCGTQTPSWSMRDPVPWDQTLAPALGARSLGPWTTREAPADITFLSQHFPSWVLQNPHSGVGWKAPRVKRAPVVSVPKKWILYSFESFLNMSFIL